MLLPRKVFQRPDSYPFISTLFGIVCIGQIVWQYVGFFFTGHQKKNRYGAFIEFLQAYGVTTDHFHPSTIFTSFFLDWWHYAPYVAGLVFATIGRIVEGRIGTLRFLLLICIGHLAAVATFWFFLGRDNWNVPYYGMAGSVYAVLACGLLLFPYTQIKVLLSTMHTGSNVLELRWYALLFILLQTFSTTAVSELNVNPVHFNLCTLGGLVAGLAIVPLFGIPRESESVSRAKEAIGATQDLTMLGERQLCDLYAAYPKRADIALHLANASLFGMGFGNQYATEAFNQHRKEILDNGDISLTCKVSWEFVKKRADFFSSAELGRLARRAEDNEQHLSALLFYRHLIDDPIGTDSDREVAAYRMGKIYDETVNDYYLARVWFDYLEQHYPMSPMAAQARLRLKSMPIT